MEREPKGSGSWIEIARLWRETPPERRISYLAIAFGVLVILVATIINSDSTRATRSAAEYWPEWKDEATAASFENLGCGVELRPDPSIFIRKVKDLELNETLNIEGSKWNNTLVEGCRISDVDGDGIRIRNVRNIAIFGCQIQAVQGTGIRLRSSGGTENVWIIENTIENTGKNGISVAKRFAAGVDHKNLIIIDNDVSDTGNLGKEGLAHGIYAQSSEVTIFGNSVEGERDGNGISIRSSGLVACNNISGLSRDGKPGIRYFADHVSGPSRSLVIRDNLIRDASPAIHLMRPSRKVLERPSGLVLDFVIVDNRATSENLLSIDEFWWGLRVFELKARGNSAIDQ